MKEETTKFLLTLPISVKKTLKDKVSTGEYKTLSQFVVMAIEEKLGEKYIDDRRCHTCFGRFTKRDTIVIKSERVKDGVSITHHHELCFKNGSE